MSSARWRLAALLAAAGLFAAPAAADVAGGDTHYHFRVVLSSSTATEGQTEKITVTVQCVASSHAFCSSNHPGDSRRHGANMTITVTNPSGANNGVTLSTNKVVGWNIPALQPGVGAGFTFGTSDRGTVQLTLQDNSAQDGTRQVEVSTSFVYTPGIWWWYQAGNRDARARVQAATLVITDDEAPSAELVVNEGSDNATTVTEAGGEDSFTVALSTNPSADVSVAVKVDDDHTGECEASLDGGNSYLAAGSAGTLTFVPTGASTTTLRTTQWDTAQTVTVQAVDDDTGNEPDATCNVELDPSSTDADYNGLSTSTVDVTVQDNERSVTAEIDGDGFDLAEGGMTDIWLVANRAVTEQVTFALSVVPIPPTVAADVTLSTTTLMIASGAIISDTFVVMAVDDNVDKGQNIYSFHVDAAATGGNVTDYRMNLNITDNDDAAVVLSDLTSASNPRETVTEAGGTATFDVALATLPTAAVTVAVSSSDAGECRVSTAGGTPAASSTLLFSTTNWSTAQTVTLTGQNDSVDDGDVDCTITAAASSTDAVYNSDTEVEDVTFTARNTDDDAAAVTLSTAMLSVIEEDSAAYTVRLATQPVGGTVTVDITGAADGLLATPTSLSFTAGNWDTAQSVTVTAANDGNSDNEMVTLTHTPSGADYNNASSTTIVVTATDDDTPSLAVSPTTLTVPEDGSETYTIRLNTMPSATTTVTVGGATAEVTVDTDRDTANDQTTLTFSAANWSTSRTVTVSAADDDDATDEVVNLTHAASGGDYAGLTLQARPGVRVTVDDDDEQAILIDADPGTANDQPGPLSLDELPTSSNNSRDYTVRLATEPTMQVTVAVSSGDRAVSVDTDVTPRTRTLTFTTTSWATAQTVAAVAAEDDDASNERVTITHTASGGDYAGLTADLAADTVDDDTRAIVVEAAALVAAGVGEGAEATYTVRLQTEPDGVVTVSVAAAGGLATVDMDDDLADRQSSLRFDASNWSTARTARVRGLQDDDAASGTSTLRHTATGAEYGAVPAVDVAFAVTDDDTPALAVAPTELAVNEGSAATYSVMLAAAPTGGPVTVSAMSSDVAAATVPTTGLMFTAGNWDRPQDVTVRGVADPAMTNAAATIAHVATGADYGGASAPPLSVTVRDTDAAGVRIEPPQLRLREGEGGAYAIRLNTRPTANVTVTPTTVNASLTLSSDPLTFTATDWRTEQTVTATIAEDNGADDETLSVTHAVTGGYAGDTAPALTVLVRDNDGIVFDPAGGLRLSAATSTLQYTAALTAQPTGDMTVRLSSNDADLEFDTNANRPNDQRELTFTVANWNAPQAVTARWVAAAEADADAATDTATLRHTASGGGYDGVLARYPVVLVDPDAAAQPQGVTATPGTRSLTVRWSAAANAEGYAVQWRRAGEDWSASQRLETTETTARITDLAAGARYLVRVVGLVRGWAGEASAEVSATVPRPRPPSPPPSPPPPSPPSPPSPSPPSSPPPAPAPPANANRAPEAQRQLADVVVDAGGTADVQLSAAFADPDGDALTYSASSSNESAARASVRAGGVLRVTGAAAGTATIEAQATDPSGLSAAQRFAVRVVAALTLAGAEAPEGGVARLRLELGRARSAPTAFRWRVLADAEPATADAGQDDHGGVSGEGSIAAGATEAEIEVAILDDATIEPAREWFAVEIELGGDAPASRTRAQVAVLEGVCDRSAAVRDALAGGAPCTAPTVSALAAVRSLDLQRSAIGALRADDLLGLSGLRDLDLSGNALRSLPDGLFTGVGNLRSLRLDGNPGAPFPLRAGLARTDAEPLAPGPATLRARVPLGAPFAVAVELTVAGGTLRGADGAAATSATVRAGATTSAHLTAEASAAGAMRILAAAPTVPAAVCGDAPCWRGIEGAGSALVLFSQPPTAGAPPAPAPLAGDELRLPLAALATAGDAGRLRWTAHSSDESVAGARIEGGELVVEPALGAEGTVRIEATATDVDGQSVTVSFGVRVEFHWPRAVWRNVILHD